MPFVTALLSVLITLWMKFATPVNVSSTMNDTLWHGVSCLRKGNPRVPSLALSGPLLCFSGSMDFSFIFSGLMDFFLLASLVLWILLLVSLVVWIFFSFFWFCGFSIGFSGFHGFIFWFLSPGLNLEHGANHSQSFFCFFCVDFL